MSKVKWTEETIQAEASKFNIRWEFQKKNNSAYNAARRLKILDKVCSHMKSSYGSWSDEDVAKEALKFSNRVDFQKHSKAYWIARYRNIVDEVCGHMEPLHIYWTEDAIFTEASKWKSRNEFSNNSPAYQAANMRGILDRVCAHMESPYIDWSDERESFVRISEEAAKYSTRVEFKNNSHNHYKAACRFGVLDLVCGHMSPSARGFNRDEPAYLYIIRFGDFCGFGITGKLEDRLSVHRCNIGQCGYLIDYVKTFYFSDGSLALKLEKMLKCTLNIVNTGVFGFITEAVSSVDESLLFNAVNQFVENSNDT